MAETIRINENTWRFEDDSVRFFLFCGTEKAALIDSGMNVPDAKKLAEGLTDAVLKTENNELKKQVARLQKAVRELM